MVKINIVDARTYPNVVYTRDNLQSDIPSLEITLRQGNLSEISKNEGPFSLVTEKDGQVLVLRNSPGNPVYVTNDRSSLYVANSLKELRNAMRDKFSYNNVRVVPSSHVARFDGTDITFERFRDELPTTQVEMSLEDIAHQLRRELTSAVTSMVEVDNGKKIAVLLSGGIDSAAVAAVLLEHKEYLIAYTLDAGGNDLKNARIVAKRLGIPLQVVPIDIDEMRSLLPRYVESAEEYRPFVIDTVPGFYFLARAASRDGIKVLFTGSAANELFGDYHADSGYDVPLSGNVKQTQRKLLIEGRKHDDPLYNLVLGSGLDRYGFTKPLMDFGIESREPWGAFHVLQFGIQIPEHVLFDNGRHTKPDIARIAFPEIGIYPEKDRMGVGSGISSSFRSDYRINRAIFEKLFNIKIDERSHNEYLRAMKKTEC